MSQVHEEDRQLDHIVQPSSRCLCDGGQVLQHAADFLLDIAGDQLHRCRVQGDLAGEIDGIARPHGLRVGADGRRRGFGGDGFAHNRLKNLR